MNDKFKKFLPIGTVVKLKGGTKRLMIIGFCIEPVENEKKQRFDYAGCLYPEGVIDSAQFPLFNHDQIEKVYNIPFADDEDIEFRKSLDELFK